MFTSGNPGSDIKKRQQRALARFLQLNVDTDLVLQLRCRRIHIFLCNLLNLCTQLMRHIHVMYYCLQSTGVIIKIKCTSFVIVIFHLQIVNYSYMIFPLSDRGCCQNHLPVSFSLSSLSHRKAAAGDQLHTTPHSVFLLPENYFYGKLKWTKSVQVIN